MYEFKFQKLGILTHKCKLFYPCCDIKRSEEERCIIPEDAKLKGLPNDDKHYIGIGRYHRIANPE